MKEQIISDNNIEFKVLIGKCARDNWNIISMRIYNKAIARLQEASFMKNTCAKYLGQNEAVQCVLCCKRFGSMDKKL